MPQIRVVAPSAQELREREWIGDRVEWRDAAARLDILERRERNVRGAIRLALDASRLRARRTE